MATKKHKLTAKQKKALKKSIKHWQNIVLGKERSMGRYNCECCILFRNNDYEGRSECDNCPIAQFTGKNGCMMTPFVKFSLYHDSRIHLDTFKRGFATTKKLKALAQDEVDFLEKVLKAGE